jgi:hypothetical protein
MWQYVRRMGKRIQSADDVEWVRRGLAIAAIEGGRRDFRDTTISLVLLRHGAERVKMPFDGLFRQIQAGEYISPENKPLFENARTHGATDVVNAVRKFGPVEWVAELARR